MSNEHSDKKAGSKHERAFSPVKEKVSLHPRLLWYIDELTQSGLHGDTRSQVIERLVSNSIERMWGSPLIAETVARLKGLNGELTAGEKARAARLSKKEKKSKR